MRTARWLLPLVLLSLAGLWLWSAQRPEPLPRDLRGRLVFVSDRDGYDALYERRLPDGPARRLAVLPDAAREPALAPDGTHVAFVMGGRIAVLGLKNGELQVLSLGVERLDASPAWSPDGHQLAISSRRRGETNADIHVLSVSLAPAAAGAPRAEAERRALTQTAGLDEREPVFGPDGTFVIFVREDNLVRLGLDGRTRRLTGGFRKVRHPRFLPDGRLLCLWSQDKVFGLDVMDAEGQGRETLSTGSSSYRSLVPSPDGRYLLAAFEYDLAFHWRDVLKLRATEELRLLDARGRALGVVERSLRYSSHSPQWGPE